MGASKGPVEQSVYWLSVFFFFFNLPQICQLIQFLAKLWSCDISRDLLTQYLYLKMLRKMSSLSVPNFESAP